MDVVPRVGENIDIPFFKAYLDTTVFYVESISHELNDQLHEINIHLKRGYYNLFWHYRKDKAKETNELRSKDLIELDDYDLKNKLRIGYWEG